jgi:hypothetical protein
MWEKRSLRTRPSPRRVTESLRSLHFAGRLLIQAGVALYGVRVGAAGVRLPTMTGTAIVPTRPELDCASTNRACWLPAAEDGIWTVSRKPELANWSPKAAPRADERPRPLPAPALSTRASPTMLPPCRKEVARRRVVDLEANTPLYHRLVRTAEILSETRRPATDSKEFGDVDAADASGTHRAVLVWRGRLGTRGAVAVSANQSPY